MVRVTLHLAFLTGGLVCQVGDRRLSQGDPGSATEWDPYANKTIVVLGQNCTAVVSYSGLGHVAKMPTDQWLAEAIAGEKFLPRPKKLFGENAGLLTNYGPAGPYHLAGVIGAVKAALETDLPREGVRGRRHGIRVLICGYTWRRRDRWRPGRARPYALVLAHSGKPGTTTMTTFSTPRYWPWDRMVWMPPTVGVDMGPRRAELVDHLAADTPPPEDVERALVDAIRKVAGDPKGDVVGTECMGVRIRAAQEMVITFHRDTALDGRRAYTPFIIAAGMRVPPSVLTRDGLSFGFGEHYVIPITTDPPLPEEGVYAMHGQPRPKAP